MRIAQLAPLYESVPPQFYGGTERVVSYLTEELVRQGHDVTLFASGDSKTSARLDAVCPRALRLDKSCIDCFSYHILMIERAFQQWEEFDIIHSHLDYLPFSLIRRHPQVAVLTTLHGRLDINDIKPVFREFKEMPLVSISDKQRVPLYWGRWEGTVYHGLPEDLYEFHPRAGDYLAFVGRICPEKRLDLAIEIAARARMPLKIAAKIDAADEKYYEQCIRKLIDGNPYVEYAGEIGEERKNEFLGGARALLFPIDWPEPFGLVLIEAMACGTPVIARPLGSVPELVKDGVTGFIADTVDEAVRAVRRAAALDRGRIRREFEYCFSAKRMAKDYADIYRRLVSARNKEFIETADSQF